MLIRCVRDSVRKWCLCVHVVIRGKTNAKNPTRPAGTALMKINSVNKARKPRRRREMNGRRVSGGKKTEKMRKS